MFCARQSSELSVNLTEALHHPQPERRACRTAAHAAQDRHRSLAASTEPSPGHSHTIRAQPPELLARRRGRRRHLGTRPRARGHDKMTYLLNWIYSAIANLKDGTALLEMLIVVTLLPWGLLGG